MYISLNISIFGSNIYKMFSYRSKKLALETYRLYLCHSQNIKKLNLRAFFWTNQYMYTECYFSISNKTWTTATIFTASSIRHVDIETFCPWDVFWFEDIETFLDKNCLILWSKCLNQISIQYYISINS